jgi:hypothetical protein
LLNHGANLPSEKITALLAKKNLEASNVTIQTVRSHLRQTVRVMQTEGIAPKSVTL